MTRARAIPWLPVLVAVCVLAAIPFAVPKQRQSAVQEDLSVTADKGGSDDGKVPWSPQGRRREQPEKLKQVARPVRTLVKPVVGRRDYPIPGMVLAAYRNAADRMAKYNPRCDLDWEILAGVGKVESNHARNGRLDSRGNTLEAILGPVLDGKKYKAVPDSDAGRYDGDTVWDRAVGPMQFLPASWSMFIVDGNNDGISSPHNIWDSTFGTAAYLCSGGTDLSVRANLAEALFGYNHSKPYVDAVLAWIDAYRAGGARAKNGPVIVAGEDRDAPAAPRKPAPEPGPTAEPTTVPTATPSPTSEPTPGPTNPPTTVPTIPTPDPDDCLVEVLDLPLCVDLPLLTSSPSS
ncbi:lytic transglycosylase domain-containing protein [Flindersiella endophytica]